MHNELTRSGGGEEIAKNLELANLLWDHELEELLTTKPFQLDQPQQQQQDQIEKQLWSIQLQQNLSENELDKNKKKNKKKLQTNKQFSEKNFQSLTLEKLVALMPEKHFALAASSQLLGNEAWEEHREASKEISFDKVGDKELLQELRREELGCKDLRPASLLQGTLPNQLRREQLHRIDLCQHQLGQRDLQREKLANKQLHKQQLDTEQLDKEQLQREQLDKEQLQREQLDKEQLQREQLDKEQLHREQLDKEQLHREQPDKAEL